MKTSEFKFLGSVSCGTMRAEDLVPRFFFVLQQLDMERALGLAEQFPVMVEPRVEDAEETRDEALDQLFDALNDQAPEGLYFGAHPGDGADYGFWPVEE